MKNKRSYFTLLMLVMTLITTLPVLAHGDEKEAVATGGTGWIIPIAIVIALVVTGVFPRFRPVKLTGWQYGILFLGLLSGIIHIGMGVTGDTLLLLNGVGYHALLGVLFIPAGFLADKKQFLRFLLVGYTAITFVGYFVIHPVDGYDAVGLFTKGVEVALLLCLIMRLVRVNQQNSEKTLSSTGD